MEKKPLAGNREEGDHVAEPERQRASRVAAHALRQAMDHHRAGRLAEAEHGYRHVLCIQRDHADAHHNLGVLAIRTGRHALAVQHFQAALEADPGRGQFWLSCLGALIQAGRLMTARELLTRGRAAGVQGGAVEELELALQRAREYADAQVERGNLLLEGQRCVEAEAALREALRIDNEHFRAFYHLGNLLQGQCRPAEAEAAYREALRLQPDCAEACNNLGVLLQGCNRPIEAQACWMEALRLRPDYAEAFNNLGALMQAWHRPAEAEAAYREAMRRNPEFADAHWNCGLLLLRAGRWAEAWPLYEYRHHPRIGEAITAGPALSLPRWQGEDLSGRSILVLEEQGHGDVMQFCRFLPILKSLGAREVVLVCHPGLVTLLGTLRGVDRVVAAWDEGRESVDCWTFLLTIPMLLGVTPATLPADLPYLRADPERVARWRERLPSGGGLRVGVVWQGRTTHKNDRHRSLPDVTLLEPLWSVAGVRFIGLRRREAGEVASVMPAGQPLLDLGGQIHDFADTAAIVAQLDLVIAVDTAIVHLCGALGARCWVLLPAIGTDWRWGEGGDDSPWYPRVLRLFRQPEPDDWRGVVVEVRAALAALCQSENG
ncbi:MAG: tetratricopeptide repeat protein [Magnetococcales bacterium]|nr:tetratricopeptide repeat protein [Magnetococcales bacterium]